MMRIRTILFFSIIIWIFAPIVNAGQSNLSWIAPTTRADGTILSANEIGGYRIYHGQIESDLVLLIELPSSPTQWIHENAPIGANYYAVTTFDTEGNESELSNVAAKIFLAAPSSVVLSIQ